MPEVRVMVKTWARVMSSHLVTQSACSRSLQEPLMRAAAHFLNNVSWTCGVGSCCAMVFFAIILPLLNMCFFLLNGIIIFSF